MDSNLKQSGTSPILPLGLGVLLGYLLNDGNSTEVVGNDTVELIDPIGSLSSIAGVPDNIFGLIDRSVGVGDRSAFVINCIVFIMPILNGINKINFYSQTYDPFDISRVVEETIQHMSGRGFGLLNGVSCERVSVTRSIKSLQGIVSNGEEFIVNGYAYPNNRPAKKFLRPNGTSFLSTSNSGIGAILSNIDLGSTLNVIGASAYSDDSRSLMNLFNVLNFPINGGLFRSDVETLIDQIYDLVNVEWCENRLSPCYGWYLSFNGNSNDILSVRALIEDFYSGLIS